MKGHSFCLPVRMLHYAPTTARSHTFMKPHINRNLFIVTLITLTLIAAPAEAQEDESDDPDGGDPRFGAVEAYHEPELADEAQLGWSRILFYWSELEREGPDDWNPFHAPLERIDREIEGGREVIGLLQNTPAWATDGVPDAGVPRGLYLPIDDPENYWASFVRDVMTIYDGRVTRWIIWNEPDIAEGDYGFLWAGSTEDYYQLLKVAYLVAHEVNPEIQIHLGATTYWHNPTYIDEFLTVASQDPTAIENGYYFDVVSTHIYFKPETSLGIIASLQQQLDLHGLSDKPIWMVETNAPPYDDEQQLWENPDFLVTQEMQASYIIQMTALSLSTGIERLQVYKWADQPPRPPGFEPYGMIRSDGTFRPAYDAYMAVLDHYAGFEEVHRIERDELFVITLTRGDQTTRVIWSRLPQALDVELPAIGNEALLIDQTGTEQTIQAVGEQYHLALSGAPCEFLADCLVGGQPLILVEEEAISLDDWERYAPQITNVLPYGTRSQSTVLDIARPATTTRALSPWVMVGAAAFVLSATVAASKLGETAGND